MWQRFFRGFLAGAAFAIIAATVSTTIATLAATAMIRGDKDVAVPLHRKAFPDHDRGRRVEAVDRHHHQRHIKDQQAQHSDMQKTGVGFDVELLARHVTTPRRAIADAHKGSG